MEKSKVFFTDFRTEPGYSLTDKLKKLCKKAGFETLELEKQFVAIKLHFGEFGNLSYLRPNYARAVAELVKEQGGLPFLTDSNTLYPGSRKHALEHLDCANVNGFNPTTCGCQILIADGLKGTDEAEIPVENGEYCETALIGRAIMDADVLISLTHFKGHESTGFGGVIKNIGMGAASRAGKMIQHNSGHPIIHEDKCKGCKACKAACGSDAITYENKIARIDQDKCKGCGRCIGFCNFDAIENINYNANSLLCKKMAEYCKAAINNRPAFHISLIMDVSPLCDCYASNDAPILPDLGMLASFDPVALDQACVDLCQKEDPYKNSVLGDNLADPHFHDHHNHWQNTNPDTAWEETLSHGEKIGLGSRAYELIQF